MNLGKRLFRIVQAEIHSIFSDITGSRPTPSVDFTDGVDPRFDLDLEPDEPPAASAPPPPKQSFVRGDYYRILGVSYTSSQRQIQKAYHNLAKKYHPDKNHDGGNGDDRSRERMKLINEAYHCLKDPERRARYNLTYRTVAG